MRCQKCLLACPCETIRIPLDRIIEVFCEVSKQPERVLRSRNRTEYVAQCRHLAVYLTYNLTDLGFLKLAPYWRRDHSTLVNSVAMAKRLIKTHPGLAHIYQQAEERLLRIAAGSGNSVARAGASVPHFTRYAA